MTDILIIEDEASVRDLLEKFLTRMGYRVDLAKDGKEGIRMLHHDHRYDAVITDIFLPEASGYEVASHIRNSEKPLIPVLAITGMNQTDVQSKVFDLVLQKPFRLAQLQSAIASFVRSS